MKKTLLSIIALMLVSFAFAQQDTLIGFSFPVNTGTDSLNPNFGISANLGYPIILATDIPVAEDSITFTNGVYSSGGTDYAATGTRWDSGANNKYWVIKFKTTGYENLVLYSAQRSGGSNPGPNYFKLQYRVSSTGAWTDFGDSIEVGNNWTTGVIDSLPIPSGAWDATQSVHIRWLSITDSTASGTAIDSAGVTKIDEIYVLGTAITSIEESDLAYKVYPNPCNGILNIDTRIDVEMLYIMSIEGRLIAKIVEPGNAVDLSALESGLYLLRFETKNTSVTHKIIIE
ncbi:MAG: T9SS type A sorting domain-containing protein [Bacteroidales bacterium]|nr:T9SS type A sorting domain-containing protein [Bacteroidales bacterium]